MKKLVGPKDIDRIKETIIFENPGKPKSLKSIRTIDLLPYDSQDDDEFYSEFDFDSSQLSAKNFKKFKSARNSVN